MAFGDSRVVTIRAGSQILSRCERRLMAGARCPKSALRWDQIADHRAFFLKLGDGGFDPGFAEFVERKVLYDLDLSAI